MVNVVLVDEIGAVNSELVVGVEFALEGKVGRPGVGGVTG